MCESTTDTNVNTSVRVLVVKVTDTCRVVDFHDIRNRNSFAWLKHRIEVVTPLHTKRVLLIRVHIPRYTRTGCVGGVITP